MTKQKGSNNVASELEELTTSSEDSGVKEDTTSLAAQLDSVFTKRILGVPLYLYCILFFFLIGLCVR